MKLKAIHYRILESIRSYIEQNHYSPSMRDLLGMVGLKSISTMHGHLERLRKLGLIDWEPSRPRTLKLINSIGEY